MLTVACVLRSGGDFRAEHVHALMYGVARNLSLPHRFVCLTDMMGAFRDVSVEAIEALPLPDAKWPGWWSKICLFAPGLFRGPVLYLDLDTIVVGSLDDIALGHRFTVLENFWADQYGEPDRIGSGMMAWDCDLSAITKRFALSPERFMRDYKTRERWGDQGFIKDHTPVEPERWQRKFPGKVVSFKKHVLKARGVPAGVSVVCFHGAPRPFDLPKHQRAWFDKVSEAA